MNKMYETVIGVEVHVELATKTKIFCGCSTAFGAMPNTQVCPVCTGMPGTLPVLNKKVVDNTIAVGLATNCDIARYTTFDRKNYFYPDNPQNYQISQLYAPICRNGYVEIETDSGKKKIGIHEIHMEEDAGKLIHDDENNCSFIDYNRSGVPLIEIVSEPDMRSAEEVIAYLEKLRVMIQYLGASDCKLQEGSMRADVNVSVREVGNQQFGTRTEMKNLNSFRAISRAIVNERERQIALLESGNIVIQETRRWDDIKGCSYTMRSKEDAKDYRYFPEPDLVSFYIDDEWIVQIKEQEPEFKEVKMIRYMKDFELPKYDADILTDSRILAELFEKTIICGAKPKKVSNWLMGEFMRLLKESGKNVEDVTITPQNLATLIHMADANEINLTVAKEVFEKIFYEDIEPRSYVEEHGLKTVSDESVLCSIIEQIIAKNPQSALDYKGGKKKAMGFIVGQTMRAMKGKADPASVNRIVKKCMDNQ